MLKVSKTLFPSMYQQLLYCYLLLFCYLLPFVTSELRFYPFSDLLFVTYLRFCYFLLFVHLLFVTIVIVNQLNSFVSPPLLASILRNQNRFDSRFFEFFDASINRFESPRSNLSLCEIPSSQIGNQSLVVGLVALGPSTLLLVSHRFKFVSSLLLCPLLSDSVHLHL